MANRKGTVAYYEARLKSGKATVNDLTEYQRLLEEQAAKADEERRRVADGMRAVKRAMKEHEKEEREARYRTIGKAVCDRFGDDVDVDRLRLGDDGTSFAGSSCRVSREFAEDAF